MTQLTTDATPTSTPLAPWVTRGFVVAGLFNLCIIGISRGFSNNLGEVDPLFSPIGCVLVCVWGLAYLSMAKYVHRAPHIAAVFAVEKLVYVGTWATGLSRYGDRLHEHPEAELFFQTYGIGDFVFAVFFAAVWWRYRADPT